jgi:hypothetical protein
MEHSIENYFLENMWSPYDKVKWCDVKKKHTLFYYLHLNILYNIIL